MANLDVVNQVDINGLSTGLWEEYFTDGKLSCTGYYFKGEKTGEWKTYLWNGNLKALGAYVNGKMNGKWTFFGRVGSCGRSVIFQLM